jgi:regulator of protease activity HflC (stomatin/prohibitin superfamily)
VGPVVVVFFLVILVLIVVAKTAIVVPQQSAYVVERLGRYSGTLDAGFHILFPFFDVIRYKHSLKEAAVDIPAQVCITRDNVQVQVDGVLYLKVLNPERASYGISDFNFAISQLAQTTLRSEVGKIELDRSFEERTNINTAVVTELDKATEPWGVKVLRYEIKNITPPADVLAAMEKQMRAEREKRARRRDQHRGRREAGSDQGVGSAQAAADQRSGRRGVSHPGGRDRDRGRSAPRRRGDQGRRRPRSHAAARRGTVRRAVRRAREEDHDARPAGQYRRRRLDDRARDAGDSQAAGLRPRVLSAAPTTPAASSPAKPAPWCRRTS